jgi:hypothetical protein
MDGLPTGTASILGRSLQALLAVGAVREPPQHGANMDITRLYMRCLFMRLSVAFSGRLSDLGYAYKASYRIQPVSSVVRSNAKVHYGHIRWR